MRYSFYLLIIFLAACQGSLSDEQRKKIREEIQSSKIKKVSESDITEAAFARGRSIIRTIESFSGDSVRIDSLLKAAQGKIRWVVPGQSNVHETEQQLIEAYISSATGGQQDNVQKIRTATAESDSLLYSKPIVSKSPDGSDRLEGVWNVWLSKKEIVLSIDN